MKQLVQTIVRYVFGLEFHLLALYRISRFFRLKVPLLGPLVSVIVRHVMRVYTSCDISPLAVIEKGVSFPHPIGIVIGEGVHLRTGAKVWQHVTIGSHGKSGEKMAYPEVRENVRIYAKASVIGGVTVGAGAVVGAHSLVLSDVLENAVVAGVPAKPIATDGE